MPVPSLESLIAQHGFSFGHGTRPNTITAYCAGLDCEWKPRVVKDIASGRRSHAAHVAEVIRAAQTVRTLDELNDLPVRSVIRDATGAVFDYGPDGEGDTVWWYDGDPEEATDVELPAIVLWPPADGAEDHQ
ncbi:hypothetical protein SEA_WHITNEY_84 [Gordonia phage Whitney]|nr:hypothetical protein SEA_WHITNEY_84 [Gordonia phage Whitney]